MEKIKGIIYLLHHKYNLHKFFIFLFFLSNIFYTFYLLSLAYHNVLLVDDYAFMAKYKQYGIFQSLHWWYVNWQGRFSPQLLTNIVIRSYESIHSLLPYTIFLISFFVYAINKIITYFLPQPFEKTLYYRFLILTYSNFLFNVFLIANFEFSTFYWLNVSTMYFWGIAFALLTVGEIIPKSRSVFGYLLICLGSIYASSSAEHFGAIFLLLLFVYVIIVCYNLKIENKDVFNDLTLNKLTIAILLSITSFLIMIFAPGNEIRRAHFPSTSIFETAVIGLKSLFNIGSIVIAEKAKYLLILGFPFIYLGALVRKNEQPDELKTILNIISSIPLFAFFIYLCLLPTAYALSDIGPPRALTHIAFYIVIYVAFISFLIGYSTTFPKTLAFVFSISCCLFFMKLTYDRIKINLPHTAKYSRSENLRIDNLLLLKASGNDSLVTLDSLYHSSNNVLFYHEIAADTFDLNKYWINQSISEGLELGFKIRVSSNKNK